MQCSERQLQLVFDTGYMHDPAVLGLLRAILQESGLPDSCLTPNYKGSAVAAARSGEQIVQHLPFTLAAYEASRSFRHISIMVEVAGALPGAQPAPWLDRSC